MIAFKFKNNMGFLTQFDVKTICLLFVTKWLLLTSFLNIIIPGPTLEWISSKILQSKIFTKYRKHWKRYVGFQLSGQYWRGDWVFFFYDFIVKTSTYLQHILQFVAFTQRKNKFHVSCTWYKSSILMLVLITKDRLVIRLHSLFCPSENKGIWLFQISAYIHTAL